MNKRGMDGLPDGVADVAYVASGTLLSYVFSDDDGKVVAKS
jgi:hypothetical protein